MQTKEFASDPLVLICPATHKLAQYQKLNLVEALSYGFIGLKAHHSLQQSIETQAKLLGFNIQYRLRLPNFSAIAGSRCQRRGYCDYACPCGAAPAIGL